MKKRICAILLVIALLIPCIPAVGAVAALAPAATGVLTSATGVVANTSFSAGTLAKIGAAASAYAAEHGSNLMSDYATLSYNCLVSIIGYGRMSYDALEQKCRILNTMAQDPLSIWPYFYQTGSSQGLWDDEIYGDTASAILWFYTWFTSLGETGMPWTVWEINDGVWVIYNPDADFVFADTTGRYPYADGMENIWRPYDDVSGENVVATVTDYGLETTLQNLRTAYPDIDSYIGSMTFDNGLSYDVIFGRNVYDESLGIWCDSAGAAFASPNFAIQAGGDRDYNDDVPDQPAVTDEPITDIHDFIIQTFPDGTFTWIDHCDFEYTEDNRTYHIDASSSYDIDNNYYYNYEWNYEYHIDYTSITYIGQTAEYDKYYEYYYDLPDGRSSADLTAAELEVLNTRIDVLEYARSTDDVSVRALYHFDGNTFDSSYWSQSGDFVWSEGASITYMDAGVFGGALYLSENPHAFSVNLPSALGSGDFTIQFRYYQSSTLTPSLDTYVRLGGAKFVQFNGESVLNSVGTALADLTPGVWNDICIMRSDGYLYYFLNGVRIGNIATSRVIDNVVEFVFGDSQQTYKYFDELRVVNKAIYPVTGYTPSAVPFDTNLTLVLPDSQLPVADAYWSFNSSYENLFAARNIDKWYDSYAFLNGDVLEWTSLKNSVSTYVYSSYYSSLSALSSCFYYSTISTLDSLESFSSLSSSPYVVSSSRTINMVSDELGTRSAGSFDGLTGGLFFPVLYRESTPSTSYAPAFSDYPESDSYTFSVVDSDSNVYSVSCDVSGLSVYDNLLVTQDFGNFRIGFTRYYIPNSSSDESLRAAIFAFIQPLVEDYEFNFVYTELVAGDSTDLTAEYVESVVVMDKDDLNTPSLAVRTQVDITGYQLGGVRPSLPTEGLVWALVESGRITSLQIYNGQAWEECDGRIWTGERWVPYYAYDVILLKDLWDVNGTDPTLDPIYTETGFWTWLQGAWKDMIARLDALISKPSGGGDINVDTDILPLFPPSGVVPGEDDDGWTIIDLAITLKDGAWILVTGVVNVVSDGIGTLQEGVESITGFFEAFDPNIPGGVFDILNMEDVDIWA